MIPQGSRLLWCLLFSLLYACSSLPSSISSDRTVAAPSAEAYFSPRRGATEAIVGELGNAKKEILLQAYSFTSAPIATALVDAHMSGVEVTVILDRSRLSETKNKADYVNSAGIHTYIDDKHLAHNKIIIIDQATIITGSFNFW
jgi:phosphatidylserine/phosphatidylglycerophosphate/cardiolipin synthase-like enzyme